MPKTLSDIQIKNINATGDFRIAPSLYLHVEKLSSSKVGLQKKFRLDGELMVI